MKQLVYNDKQLLPWLKMITIVILRTIGLLLGW